jgi:hypothetical protein
VQEALAPLPVVLLPRDGSDVDEDVDGPEADERAVQRSVASHPANDDAVPR